MKKMIAYCGLNCEKCDAYLATINDDQKLREKTAKLWAQLNDVPILPEHINCQGCRADGIKTVFCDNICDIRQCSVEKGRCYLRRLFRFGKVLHGRENLRERSVCFREFKRSG